MAYRSAIEGGYATGASVIHVDSSHPDSIAIADAQLIFGGDYHRAGPDLVITGEDGRHHVIPGYFSSERHPALVAPNGARLTADIIDLLAGSPAPGQYAQAQPTASPDPIGKVEKIVGDVHVVRNGVSVALNVGDLVYKSDVIETGANSSAGIGFPDGTALDLVASTRMALNEYSFEPNSPSDNSALFTLVQGGFAFVAGEVAHNGTAAGGMKIATPVATMGIRGTAGYALEQVATVTANVGNVTFTFAVIADPGTDHVGSYALIDQFGNEVAVNQAGIWTNVSWNGANAPPSITQAAMTTANFAIEAQLVPELTNILSNLPPSDFQHGTNPQTPGSHPGSGDNPNLLNGSQGPGNNGPLLFTGAPINTPSGPATPTFTVTSNSNSNSNNNNALPSQPPENPNQENTGGPDNWVGASPGPFNSGPNWNLGVPTGTESVVINAPQGFTGPFTVTVSDAEAAAGLTLGANVILDIIGGGSFTVATGIGNSGAVLLDSSGGDPVLMINGTVDLLDGGTIQMQGPAASNMIVGVASTLATLVNVNNTIIGSGSIGQGDRNLSFTNGGLGVVEAKALLAGDSGVLTINTGNADINSGVFEAAAGGTLQIGDPVTNIGAVIAENDGVVALSGNASISGGAITGAGALHVTGSNTINGGADVSVSQINVDGGKTLTLNQALIDGSAVDLGQGAGSGHTFTEISVPGLNGIGPSISADGQFVAFIASSNLPGQSGDVNGVAIELYNVATQQLTNISAQAPAPPAGDTLEGFNNVPSISADGRFVVFDEKYLIPNDNGPAIETSEVLLYDSQLQTVTVVQTSASQSEISGNGQFIAMQASPAPGNDSGPSGESVLVTDLSGNVLTDITGDPNFVPQNDSNNFAGAGSVYDPALSGNGRLVSFWTTASQIEVNGTLIQTNNNTGNAEVYVYDRQTNTLQMVSANAGQPGNGESGTLSLSDQSNDWPSSLSADGRFVVFQSTASNLVAGPGDQNGVSNIFLYDTVTHTVQLVSIGLDGAAANGASYRPEISPDGNFVTFASAATNLVAGDASDEPQTFVYNVQTGTITLVSAAAGGAPADNESDLGSGISDNGAAVAFGSLAGNLVNAGNGDANIFVTTAATLDVTGDSTISDGASVTGGSVIVENGVTLSVDGTVTFAGGGLVTLGGGGAQILGAAGAVLVNASTITGSGVISLGTLTNQPGGAIIAGAGGAITLNLGSGSWNYGFNEATTGGLLTINTQTDTGNSGVLEALSGGTVDLNVSPGVTDNIGGNFGTFDAAGGAINIVGGLLNGNSGDGTAPNGSPLGNGLVEALSGGIVNITGDVTNQSGAVMEASGSGSQLIISDDQLNNAGSIEALDPAKVVIALDTGSWNYGLTYATSGGTLIANVQLGTGNSGTVEAANGGTNTTNVENIGNPDTVGGNYGTIEAVTGGIIDLNGGSAGFLNSSQAFALAVFGTTTAPDGVTPLGNGLIQALTGGTVDVTGNLTNAVDATIQAVGPGSTVESGTTPATLIPNLNNSGTVAALDQGSVSLTVDALTNNPGGVLMAGDGGTFTLDEELGGSTNQGTLLATTGGIFTVNEFGGATATNGGVIEATDGGTLTINHFDTASNDALIEALNGGTVILNDNTGETNAATGVVMAADGGTVDANLVTLSGPGTGGNFGFFEALTGGTVNVTGGTAIESGATDEAIGFGSTLNFSNSLEGAGFENIGTILAQAGAIVSFNAATINSQGGLYEANGGTIFFSSDSTLVGAPMDLQITSGGVAHFADVIDRVVDVTFGVGGFPGSGTLELDQPPNSVAAPPVPAIKVVVTDFGQGDTIDLTNLAFTTGETVGYDSGVLTVTDGEASEQFTINGPYTQSDFALIGDPFGGTEIVFGAAVQWTGGTGNWNSSENWNDGSGPVPTGLSTAEIVTSGSIVTIDDLETAGNLVIGGPTSQPTLDIVDGGSLVDLNALDDGGTLNVESSGGAATLQVYGPVSVESSASIDVFGTSLASATFTDDQVGNGGTMSASSGGTMSFDGATIFNQGSAIIEAETLGTVVLSDTTVHNDSGATISASGTGASVQLATATIIGGTLQTSEGGVIETVSGHNTFDGLTIASGSQVQVGAGSALVLEDAINNDGTIDVNGGSLFANSNAAIGGSGSIGITGGGLAEFADVLGQDGPVSITFGVGGLPGAGTLALAQQPGSGLAVAGFGLGDTFDLTSLAFSSNETAVWTQLSTSDGGAGTLQIFNGNGVLEDTLSLDGIYAQGQFALTQDSTPAHGTDVNFNAVSFNGGTTNVNTSQGADYVPQVSNGGTALTLTDGNVHEANTWFDTTPVSIDSFTASFDYQASPGNPEPGFGLADGFAFILQDSPAGTSAVGDIGGPLGYDTISPSAAVEFNIYDGNTQGTNFATDGSFGTYNPTGAVAFWNGDPIQVVLSYNGSVLTETLTDLTNGATYTANYDVNLAAVLGANTALVGFSGSSGDGAAIQTVSNFTFEAGQPLDVWTNGLDSDWGTGPASNWSVGAPPAADEPVLFDASGVYIVTITTAAAAQSLTITSAGVDIQDEAGGSLALNGSLAVDAGSFSLIGGTLAATLIDVESAGHFIGEGSVTAPLDNNGGFVEALGNLSLLGAVDGSGTYQIDNGNQLEFGTTVAGGTVEFGGSSGTLKIDAPANFHAEISMAHSDPSEVLDLGGFNSQAGDVFTTTTSLNAGVTTLTVTDVNQGTSESVQLVGDFTGATWNVNADGGGGADVSDPPPPPPPSAPAAFLTSVPGAVAGAGAITNAGSSGGAGVDPVPGPSSSYDGASTSSPAGGDASADDGGVVTVTDGGADAQLAQIKLTPGTPVVEAVTNVDGSMSEFPLGSDQINLAPGQTATDSYSNVTIPDPQNPGQTTTGTVSISVGGPGSDNFVFAPGIGADTIVNFNPQNDTIELDHFANLQNVQQLAALITTDAHGDALIELGHNDSIALPGVTPSYLQAHLQTLVHLG